ncbi:MAG: helix-turn-helix domain-containing protein [Microthrixaceae bacterium]
MTPRLVVGQTRLKSDLDLGHSMTVIGERFLGIAFDYLGHIEQDDAVWLTVRRMKPLLIDSPASKSARNIERVARRILAMLAAQATRGLLPRHAEPVEDDLFTRPSRPPDPRDFKIDPPATLYDVLGVARTSTDDEIRRAYKRQREIFREGGLPTVSVVSPTVLRKELARIEEAHDTLLDMVRRRAYDLSTFPDDAPEVVPARTQSASQMAELMMMQAELGREINAETQFTGALLRKVRESQGVEIPDIGRVTKISNAHILAIENESPADLPAAVYVQGFVQQIARFLKLDPAQVTKTYMRRLRDAGSRTVRGS